MYFAEEDYYYFPLTISARTEYTRPLNLIQIEQNKLLTPLCLDLELQNDIKHYNSSGAMHFNFKFK